MRTLLSQFCEEFDSILRALIHPAHETAAALSAASDELSCKSLRPPLVDLALQLESLADKVAEQHAYVLIFGPLKSGKSTLMNALAGTYVSEVSSLPAYPCMVYVAHAPEREYTVTRYSCATQIYSDPEDLHLAIHRAHGELAERLRQAGSFDPATDFPEAIRRIDFKLPAGELAESSTVLVDTPGLYSRMKFGYDRMTREFKSSAACAIFVVKPDNLFLEQVFAEFTELLELFSRIFLVVNVDSQKRDLSPDGSLRPSLEAENPLRIIEAFEDLAMSAPLKQAADEGRLKIYPIDLLHAASDRLSGKPGDGARFDTFRTDLTDYLNSTEYLVAFLGDSLRRAKTLLDELDDIAARPEVDLLRTAYEAIRDDLSRATERKAALATLSTVDWRGQFALLQERLSHRFGEARDRIEERTRGVLDGAVDAWFKNDDSLDTFNRKVVSGALRGHQEELLVFMERELRDAVGQGNAGLQLKAALERQLHTAEFDLGLAGSTALGYVTILDALLDPTSAIQPAQLPVKKRFWDWVLFRSAARVQKRFFGAADRPTNRVTRADKQRRLGNSGREAMLHAMDALTHEFFESSSRHLESILLETYAERATERVLDALANKRAGVERRHADLVRQHDEHRAILDNLDHLLGRAHAATVAVESLWEDYGSADPALLKVPLESASASATAEEDEAEAGYVMFPTAPAAAGSDHEPSESDLEPSEPDEIRLDL